MTQARLSGAAMLSFSSAFGLEYIQPSISRRWTVHHCTYRELVQFISYKIRAYPLAVTTSELPSCFWENDIRTFLKQQSMRVNAKIDEHDLGLVHLHDATLLPASRDDAKLLVIVTNK